MAWLKLYETETFLDPDNGFEKLTIPFSKGYKALRVNPQCVLFDNKWERILEACNYLDHRLNIKRQKWNTIEAKGHSLKLFYDFLEYYTIGYDTVNAQTVNDFIAWLLKDETYGYWLGKKTKRTAKTVNARISHIRDFYRYHSFLSGISDPFEGEIEYINRPSLKSKGFFYHLSPSGKVQQSSFTIKERGKKPITILKKTEIRALLDACTLERDQLMIKLMLLSGMRIGEILCLKVDAIGIADQTAKVQQLQMLPSPSDDKRRSLKTGERIILIPPYLMDELDRYYVQTWIEVMEKTSKKHNYFFISEGNRSLGSPLTYAGVVSCFKKLFETTGIRAMPHDFRHTYATNLARLKTDIATLAKMLGHSNLHTVGVYIKIAEMEEAANILEEFYSTFTPMEGL